MATATTHFRIGPADHGRTLSLDEFLDAEEQPGYRYELARGVLEVTQVPDEPHGLVVCNLYDLLARYRQAHPQHIFRYGGAAEFRLWLPGMVSGRNPDMAVVLRTAPRDPRSRRIPALAAEVVSPGGEERDYVAKREEYLRFGLLEYWIVDPTTRNLTILLRDGDVWREARLQGDAPIVSQVLPGLDARVRELWADLDEEAENAPTV